MVARTHVVVVMANVEKQEESCLETAWTELVWGVIGCFQVSGLCGWGGQE